MLSFLGGIILGALASWLITRYYYIKASKEQKGELQKLSDKLRQQNTLQDFEQLLGSSSWQETAINHSRIWVCDSNNTFQIEKGERARDLTERWTTVYPDRNSSAYPIYLKIGGVIVKELLFISMDGGRIFVPMAEVRPTGNDKVEYFWNINSLEVKVCRIVGDYYIYNDLEGIAKMSHVAIVK